MIVLAFDTAMAACSVALWRDGATLAAQRNLMERGQAEHLAPMIAAVMAEAKVGFESLDRIAVTVGPGSFTGVRVALAAAHGLALARKLPIIGLTTGEVLAAQAAATDGAAAVVSLIDSKRGDVYVESFGPGAMRRTMAVVMSPAEVATWLAGIEGPGTVALVGDGVAAIAVPVGLRFRHMVNLVFPDAAVLAQEAARRAPPTSAPVPLYVRPPDVTMPAAAS